jgi:hypothetical protein
LILTVNVEWLESARLLSVFNLSTGLVVTVSGWLIGFYSLHVGNIFKPAANSVYSEFSLVEQWGSSSFIDVLLPFKTGQASAAETLLFGSVSRRQFGRNLTIVLVPLITWGLWLVLFQFLDWPGQPQRSDIMADLLDFCLVFSLALCNFTAFSFGELAARCRLLWLRHPGDRIIYWRMLERYVLQNIMQITLIGSAMCLVMLFTPLPKVNSILYFLCLVCSCLFSAYHGLSVRINGLTFINGLVVCGMLVGFFLVPVISTTNDLLTPMAILYQVVLLTLAAFYRHKALHGFEDIDWNTVKPNPSKLTRPMLGGGFK